MGKAPSFIVLEDDRIALRDYHAEHLPRPAGSGWPMTCIGSGVNAAQAGELREFLGRNGCPTEVTGDGDPVYTSATHRKKALRLRGMVDKSSFC